RPVSGWGFLGMLSGVARDADQTNHVVSDRLSGWCFLRVLGGYKSTITSASGSNALSSSGFADTPSGVTGDINRAILPNEETKPN
ncbi:MAG: hypothetical protein ABEH81_15140, partial [Halopenitus sp.]